MKRKIATKSVEAPNEDILKKHREKERRAKLLIALLCVALSAIAVVPFFFFGHREAGTSWFELRMPTTHDMFLHYDQMRSFYKGLAAGEIYPRWEEETNRGFGAPTTSYYPPGVYYLTSAFYSVTRDWVRALLDAHLLMMIAAAAAIYFYARQGMAPRAAIVAMTAYIFLPYHLIDQYQRGAIAELLGFIWMPLILLFGERLMRMPAAGDEAEKHSRRRSLLLSVAGLAASYGAFLWSHPPTAYQFTLAFGLYVIVLSIIRKEWKGLLSVGASIVIALGLSAVYLASAELEQNLIRHEYISETWPYHKTYVFVHDLFNYQFHRQFFRAVDLMWITGAVVIVGSGIVFVVKRRAVNIASSLKQRITLWLMLGAAASFMMTKASMPLGKLIPKIDIGVFTWRMLSITTLVIALLAGAFTQAALNAAREDRRSMRLFGSLAGFILVGAFVFSAIWVVGPIAGYDVFVPEAEHFNGAMIPTTAPAIDPEELPNDVPQAELSEENGEVSVEEWKPQHRVIRADLTDDDLLLVRTFNFPGWTAFTDGNQVPITTSEELGDMEIELPAGSHQVTLDFFDTPKRRRMKIVTLCSFGVLLLGTGAGVITRRRHVPNP